MADKPQAQSKMGELFIDIGTSGLGTLLKGLNSVSASFLLAKKGAEEFIKPIKKVAEQSTKSAIDYSKLSKSLGTSILNVQKLKAYINAKNLDESMLGDIASMQSTFFNLQRGFGGINGQAQLTLNELGLNPQDYSPELEGMLSFFKDIKERQEALGLSDLEKRMQLEKLDIDAGNWLYAWSRGDFNLNDAFLMTDEEAERLIRAAESWKNLTNNMGMAIQKGVSHAAPLMENVNNSLEGGLEYIVDPSKRSGINGTKIQSQGTASKLETIPNYDPIYGGGASAEQLTPLPQNLREVTINNENHFVVKDNNEAVNIANGLTYEQIMRGEQNQYQAHNTASL